MSSSAIKGIEVLLIAGGVLWFAYSQLEALKRTKPSDPDPAEPASADATVSGGDPTAPDTGKERDS